MNNYRFAIIHWEDIEAGDAWTDSRTMDSWKAPIMKSVCYVYSIDKKYVKTFATLTVDEQDRHTFGDTNIIPKGCIKSIEYIPLYEEVDKEAGVTHEILR